VREALSVAVGASKAAAGYAPALGCGSPSLREGYPALLDRMARRETRCATCGRSAQTVPASQITKRALRARGHALCAARRRISRADAHPTTALPVSPRFWSPNTTSVSARWAVPGRGDFWGAEHRSSALGARTRALRDLTRRDCLSGATAGRAASFAARARCEKRRGVGAKRRPPQHEPLPGTARRAAHNLRTH